MSSPVYEPPESLYVNFRFVGISSSNNDALELKNSWSNVFYTINFFILENTKNFPFLTGYPEESRMTSHHGLLKLFCYVLLTIFCELLYINKKHLFS